MKKLLLFCGCLGLPACKNTHKKLTAIDQTCFSHAKMKKQKYRLRIAGVECKQCVWAVLSALNEIKEITDVACVCHKKQYDEAYFLCTFSQKISVLPLEDIKKRLADENFEVESLYGRFKGVVFRKNTEYFLHTKHVQEPVKLLADQCVLDLLPKNASRKDAQHISILGTWQSANNSLHVDDVEL